MHFSGDQRGEMFGGHDHPMRGFRGRDGMNMGPMDPMHQGLHPMDRRRMDGPPMWGYDMDPRDTRGRELNQDLFRPEEETDFRFRRHVEISIREKIMDTSDFPGPGRNVGDMGGRDMPLWESDDRLLDMRDRESFHRDMLQFNRPNFDDRSFPMDQMEPNYGYREMHDRHLVGVHDADRFNLDFPPHERRMMDFDRREEPPFSPRSRFDSDVDFRNRPGPPIEFKGRDRSPLRFGRSDDPSVDRERSDTPSNVVSPQQSGFGDSEDRVSNRRYPESGGSPVMDYRSGEEMTLAEEWKTCRKIKSSFMDPFHDRNKPPAGFQGKDASFSSGEHFTAMDLPPVGSKSPQHHLPLVIKHPTQLERDNKKWPEERDPKYVYNKSNRDERSPFHPIKESSCEIQDPGDSFKEMKNVSCDQVTSREDFENEPNFPSSSTLEAKDQDYRDIDYRTGSVRMFDYKNEELKSVEKLLKDSKSFNPSAFTDSATQVCEVLQLFIF